MDKVLNCHCYILLQPARVECILPKVVVVRFHSYIPESRVRPAPPLTMATRCGALQHRTTTSIKNGETVRKVILVVSTRPTSLNEVHFHN